MASSGLPRDGAHVRRKDDGLIAVVFEVRDDGILGVRWLEKSECKTLILSFEQFARDWEVMGKRAGGLSRYKSAVTFPVIIGICFYIWLKACVGPSTESTYPGNVMDHHMSVVNGRNELNITLKLRKGSDDDFFLPLAPVDMEEILKHEQQQSSGEYDLVFHIVGDIGGGYNDYGNPIPSNVVLLFDIRYTKFDIMQINWEHRPSPGSLLNIGAVSNISQYGASVGQSYCQEAREWTQVFCENF